MREIVANLNNVRRFFASFSEEIPTELIQRACRPKPIWSSEGEAELKSPQEGRVPMWLIYFYETNKELFGKNGEENLPRPLMETSKARNNQSQPLEKASKARSKRPHRLEEAFEARNNRFQHFKEASEVKINHDEEVDMENLHMANRRELFFQLLFIVIYALPSENMEIIGEEVVARFVSRLTLNVLPALSTLTDEEIRDCLLYPRSLSFDVENSHPSDSVYSLFQFLLSVLGTFGSDHPDIPRSFPKRVFSLVVDKISVECKTYCNIILDTIDTIATADVDAFRLSSLSHFPPFGDQRCNATIRACLGILVSSKAIVESPGILADDVTRAISTWRPLSMDNPSTMEYLAGISSWTETELKEIGKPPRCMSPNLMALRGFLQTKNGRYDAAATDLQMALKLMEWAETTESVEYRLTAAELVGCFNLLHKEKDAEKLAKKTLRSGRALGLGAQVEDTYLLIALADSLIGQAKYEEAISLLQRSIDHPLASDTVVMLSILRLAKSERRLGSQAFKQRPKLFKPGSSLWRGVHLQSRMYTSLRDDYFDEVACHLSQLSLADAEQLGDATRLIEVIESITAADRYTSPPLSWLREVRRIQIEHIARDIVNVDENRSEL